MQEGDCIVHIISEGSLSVAKETQEQKYLRTPVRVILFKNLACTEYTRSFDSFLRKRPPRIDNVFAQLFLRCIGHAKPRVELPLS